MDNSHQFVLEFIADRNLFFPDIDKAGLYLTQLLDIDDKRIVHPGNGNITNDFSLTKELNAQLRADYKASEVILQDRYRPAYGFDAGAKYDFAHNRATLSLSARDIFNTRRRAFLRVSDALLLDWQRVTYSARASLTFTWRFGNNGSEPKRPKQPEEQQGKRIENR